MRSGRSVDAPIHPALAVLIVLGVVILAWLAVVALVLSVLLTAGSPGLALLVIGGACVWAGLK